MNHVFRIMFFTASAICALISVAMLSNLLPALGNDIHRWITTPSSGSSEGKILAELIGNAFVPIETFILGLLGFGGMAWVMEHDAADGRRSKAAETPKSK